MNPLILALDAGPDQARALIRELKDCFDIFKIGSRLFTEAGPQAVEWVRRENRKVFLDLKFHDIPLTVAESCRNAARLGVWGFTIHAGGGFAMIAAAGTAVREEAQVLRSAPPLVFAVTVLTSLADPDLKEIGVQAPAPDQVRRLAALAQRSGADGVVASGNEIEVVRAACGADFKVVVPGIRPARCAKNEDQKRVATPQAARRSGADYLVVGRPVLEAEDRVRAAQELIAEVSQS